MEPEIIESKPEHQERARLEAEVRILKDLLARAGNYTSELEAELESAGEEIRRLRGALRESEEILEAVYASRSWKLTLPVRIVSGLARTLLGRLTGRSSNPGKREPDSPENPSAAAGSRGGRRNGTGKKSMRNTLKQRESKLLSPRETEICLELTRLVKEEKNK